jgi:hypothetical protein
MLLFNFTKPPTTLEKNTGNQARLRPLSQHARGLSGSQCGDWQPQNEPIDRPDRAAAPGSLWDFGKVALFPPDRASQSHRQPPLAAPPFLGAIQWKLTVGAVDDPLEREADRVADHVTRMPEPLVTGPAAGGGVARRKFAEHKAEAATLQPKPSAAPRAAADEHTADLTGFVRRVLSAPGNRSAR